MKSKEWYRSKGTPLIRLIEECSELIKELCKIERFGIDDFHPVHKIPNRELVKTEINDVKRTMAEFEALYEIESKPDKLTIAVEALKLAREKLIVIRGEGLAKKWFKANHPKYAQAEYLQHGIEMVEQSLDRLAEGGK